MSRPNVPLMLLSVLISVMLWLVVFGRDLPAPQKIQLNVHFTNLDPDKWYLDPELRQGTVSLNFFGPSDKLEDIKARQPTVDVDLSDAREGTFRYPAELNPNSYSDLLVKKTFVVPVTLERVTSKPVPVRVKLEGTLSDPRLTANTRSSRDMAQVSGPRSLVDRVTYCRAWFNLSSVDPLAPAKQLVTLTALDDSDSPYKVHIEPVTVEITPDLTATPTEKTALVTPQFVGQPAPGFLPGQYRIDPATVEITGDPADLANSNPIPTDPIDVNGLTSDRLFRVHLRVPPKLKLKDRRTVAVLYRVIPDPAFQRGSPGQAKPPTDTFPSTVPPLNGSRGGGP